MIIAIHAGHNPDGKTACGAVGLIKESTEARAVVAIAKELLEAQGHTVHDCTCDNGTSQSDVLNKIIAKTNACKPDLSVSVHFNAGAQAAKNGKTTGTEVLVYSATGKAAEPAKRICEKIAALGFANRGVKVRTGLAVLKRTKAPSLLVECCFVDDPDDVAIYAAQAMAAAIAEGITGEQAAPEAPAAAAAPASSYLVRIDTLLLNIRSEPGTSGAIVGHVTQGDVYTITATQDGWGRLKSGRGWICLKYTQRV